MLEGLRGTSKNWSRCAGRRGFARPARRGFGVGEGDVRGMVVHGGGAESCSLLELHKNLGE